jgi:hypothetical protein
MTLSTVQPAFRPFKLATISVALEPSEVRQSLVQRKIDYLAEMYCFGMLARQAELILHLGDEPLPFSLFGIARPNSLA